MKISANYRSKFHKGTSKFKLQKELSDQNLKYYIEISDFLICHSYLKYRTLQRVTKRFRHTRLKMRYLGNLLDLRAIDPF